MNYNNYFNNKTELNRERLIADETARISWRYGKSFLDCDDLMKLTGLGRDNVRALMRSKAFPVTKVGNRQVVSVLAFAAWQVNSLKEVA